MKEKKLIISLIFLSLIFIGVTLILYLFKFGSLTFSSKDIDWVNFANYFSGILNPILTLFNLFIFAYLSVKLIKIEDERNNWTLQELARPYANLLFEDSYDHIEITIHNVGLGPLILKDLAIFKHQDKKYKNFYDLVSDIAEEENVEDNINPKIDSFQLNSESGAIAKDQSHCIFKLYFIENDENSREFINLIRKRLSEFKISITYNDMYGREIECMEEKLHFTIWD